MYSGYLIGVLLLQRPNTPTTSLYSTILGSLPGSSSITAPTNCPLLRTLSGWPATCCWRRMGTQTIQHSKKDIIHRKYIPVIYSTVLINRTTSQLVHLGYLEDLYGYTIDYVSSKNRFRGFAAQFLLLQLWRWCRIVDEARGRHPRGRQYSPFRNAGFTAHTFIYTV